MTEDFDCSKEKDAKESLLMAHQVIEAECILIIVFCCLYGLVFIMVGSFPLRLRAALRIIPLGTHLVMPFIKGIKSIFRQLKIIRNTKITKKGIKL